LGQMVRFNSPSWSRDFIRTSIYLNFPGSIKLLHAWIILVIVKQHLLQIGRIDGITEYASYILTGIRLHTVSTPLLPPHYPPYSQSNSPRQPVRG
jgi:hypothetical protein